MTEWPVPLGVHTIVISMAGPVNGISTQRVDRRASCKWEHRVRDTNHAIDSLDASPSSSCTFKPGYTLLGNS